jgi:hypothetical protein
LLAVAPDQVDALVDELGSRDSLAAAVIGHVVAGPAGTISIRE